MRLAMGSYNPAVIFGQLPPFTIAGLLPPYVGGDPTAAHLMAPYPTTIDLLVRHFATSPRRREILQGFLGFRQALASAGICDGFHWLNGSFSENVELRENRDPGDLDLVTFFRRPIVAKDDATFAGFFAANRNLFTPAYSKQQFSCDTYFVDLDTDSVSVVAQTRYWYGLFSHRRVTGEWKGMIELPVALSQADVDAANMLGQQVAP
ncbi:MAG TPA: hypothetical protein VFQ79_01240 [Bryobacteraceae bacterium]|nr:hypothetical protein [Bryobacteraceae bacterium]